MTARPKYTNIITFGDSLADLKNAFSLTLGLIPPPSLYFDGRFTNGFLAIEQLSEMLGLSQNSYYDDQVGNNFAVAGARTGRDNSNNVDLQDFGIRLPGLADQVDTYLTQLDTSRANKDTLYYIWAGPNDFLDYLAGRSVADPAILLENSVQNISNAITRLSDAGATQFLVPNISLGRLPISAPFRAEADNISRIFNASLALALDQVERSKNDIHIFEVDFYGVAEQVARLPEKFGFDNVTDPFLIPGVTLPDPSLQTGYVFWDIVHPTGEGHELVAKTFYQTLSGQIPQVTLNPIEGSNGSDFLWGTSKSDSIYGLSGIDLIFGRAENDRIHGNDGADRIFGNRGEDILHGGHGSDIVLGGVGKDIIFGGDNDDTLWGQAHDDIAIGNDGNDVIGGGLGADYLVGGRGNDLIRGRSQNDSLNGGEDEDILWGGAGDDLLEGGEGNDTLLGGRGYDIAQYRNSFETYVLEMTSNQLHIIGAEGKDTLTHIEVLQFSDQTVLFDELNSFLPNA